MGLKIAIASDHGGYWQKQELVSFIAGLGHEVIDAGPDDDASVDYPDYAVLVADLVADGTADRGVLICGTGIGMAIASNKVPGVYAANVTTPEFAALAREHNNANVLTLSGRFVDLETNKEIVAAFLETPFAGGRHERRVKKTMRLDGEYDRKYEQDKE